jgi:hypothetical protein
MRKTLLTLGAIIGVAADASAQGYLSLVNPSSAGFNTATSTPASLTGWYTGNLTLSIYTIPASGNAAMVNAINLEEQSASTIVEGISQIAAGSLWTRQDISPSGGGAEAASQTISITNGVLTSVSQGNYTIGTSGTLSPTEDIYYALVFASPTIGVEGAVVLNGIEGYTPGTAQTPDAMSFIWPVSQQNVFMPAIPEPATFALAGFGGLSMLFLRCRQNSHGRMVAM